MVAGPKSPSTVSQAPLASSARWRLSTQGLVSPRERATFPVLEVPLVVLEEGVAGVLELVRAVGPSRCRARRPERVRATLGHAVSDTRAPAVASVLGEAPADGDPAVRRAAAQRADAAATTTGRAGWIGAIPRLEGLAGGDVQPWIDGSLAGLRSGDDSSKQARERGREGS